MVTCTVLEGLQGFAPAVPQTHQSGGKECVSRERQHKRTLCLLKLCAVLDHVLKHRPGRLSGCSVRSCFLERSADEPHFLIRLLALQVIAESGSLWLEGASTMASLHQTSFVDASSTLPSAEGWQQGADTYSMLNAIEPVEMCGPARRLRREAAGTVFFCMPEHL